MKRKLKHKLWKDETASAWPIIIVLIVLGIASVLVLLFGQILEPFFNLMDSSDDSISPSISAPRGIVTQILQIIWPRGLLLVIFLGIMITMFMEYQDIKYERQ